MITDFKIQVCPGLELYKSMKYGFDFTPVLKTAVKECGINSIEDANDLLDAFLQWIAAMPAKKENTTYVMLKSDVDRIFHAFVLNTGLYRDFCETFFGHFIDHTPLEGQISKKWVDYTVNLLSELYGNQLHPALKIWEDLATNGAWEVSCGKC
ncbi:hypothetical protein HZC33_03355 [Candidatus Wolfebacteria bacterium]|nr:hypothetical protein [Candidatus Wolfebacteria bacterium]